MVEFLGVGVLSYSCHPQKFIPDSNDQLLISSPRAALQHHSRARNPPAFQKTVITRWNFQPAISVPYLSAAPTRPCPLNSPWPITYNPSEFLPRLFFFRFWPFFRVPFCRKRGWSFYFFKFFIFFYFFKNTLKFNFNLMGEPLGLLSLN